MLVFSTSSRWVQLGLQSRPDSDLQHQHKLLVKALLK